MRLASVLLLLVVATPVAAQSPMPDEARRRLDARAGAWEISMELYDRQGAVRGRVTGTDTATWLPDRQVLRIVTRFPELDDYSESWMFWDPGDRRFKNVAVDRAGNFWHLSGDLERWVLTSHPRPTPTGTIVVRFHHVEADGGFTAKGEYSVDQGATWIPLSLQTFRRGRRRRKGDRRESRSGPIS